MNRLVNLLRANESFLLDGSPVVFRNLPLLYLNSNTPIQFKSGTGIFQQRTVIFNNVALETLVIEVDGGEAKVAVVEDEWMPLIIKKDTWWELSLPEVVAVRRASFYSFP